MSDTCFICLNISNNKVCCSCNIRSHYKCWTSFLKNTNTPDICPQCKCENIQKIHNTRLRSSLRSSLPPLHSHYKQVIPYLTRLLDICHTTVGIEQKRIKSIQIFEYLIINKWFLHQYDKFKNTVQNKLVEMYKCEPHWKYPSEVYMKLFNTQIYI
jgi:hypothetical protein